ncbi:uncharacterized protein LOC122195095 isoform X2 [Lactuca sativa]|uniref:uncharacterized protein LOC122195095 isoform X2 n=1 Tax=Lactuca sativa TaxID=4236 RepID=UPI001C68B4F2|nr:uncharacterized protein LOC122195095 isoform X2 [Lactuca sativa]
MTRRKARGRGSASGPCSSQTTKKDRRRMKLAGGASSVDSRRGSSLRVDETEEGGREEAAKFCSSLPDARCKVRALQEAVVAKTRPSDLCGRCEQQRKKTRGKGVRWESGRQPFVAGKEK